LSDLEQILKRPPAAPLTQSSNESQVTVAQFAKNTSVREVQDVITFFKAAFTIILALGFGEAFKQFVSDKNEAEHIYRERLPALLSFLFLFMPFFQGMSRYFSDTYGDLGNLPQPYAIFLMIDGLNFTIEAALFFIMSRALSPQRWLEFYVCVLLLLVVDSIWAFISWFWHGAEITTWLTLNIISGAILIMMLLKRKQRNPVPASKEAMQFWPWLACVLMIFRTIADYGFAWDYYFPTL
jgi:hypothetical protein